MANFNEFLMIEEFINVVFRDLRCLLDPRNEPSKRSTEILYTIDEIIEQSAGDPEIRVVKATDQLL